MSEEMYGKRVTKATLITLEEVQRSVTQGWMEVWLPDGYRPDGLRPKEKAFLDSAFVIFGEVTVRGGKRMDRILVRRLYNRRPGFRIWVGPPPTDEERAAAPWET